jgi:pilus assembly protein CpaC
LCGFRAAVLSLKFNSTGDNDMSTFPSIKSGFAAATLAAALATAAIVAAPVPAQAQVSASGKVVVISIGKGQQVNLGTGITDVFVSDPAIADVEVKSARQIYIMGRGPGETTVTATDAAGRTVYTATVRVGGNLDSIDQMMMLAMPDSEIKVTTMNGVILLTGTVANPEEAAEAERLAQAFVGTGTKVISRLRNATPLQVNLQVRIAEVSRSLAKEISGNLKTRDNSNGVVFGVGRGRDFVDIANYDTSALPVVDASSQFGLPAGSISLPFDPKTGSFVTGGTQYNFKNIAGANVLQAAGKLFGLDMAAAFDLSERAGLVSTLAQPNLTTVSGETGDFLAGGSFPIPTSSGFGGTSVTYQSYGVSLTYTPVVLANGRISLRIRTEVSDISSQGAVRIGGLEIPATTSRMAETTVELGSGQSMMIAGLLSNSLGSSVDKMPGAGDLPIVGALFKSNGWRRNETELMIVLTPYLVKPVSDSEIKLPTDGLHSPNDLERVLLNKVVSNKNDTRPMPSVAPTPSTGPDFGSVSEAAPALPKKAGKASKQASAPGFSFD